MRGRTSIVLFIIAAALVAYYLFVERPRTDDNAVVPAPALAEFDPESIDSVAVERPDGTLEFHIPGTHWLVSEPVRDTASPSSVIRLINAISSAYVERDMGAADDLEPFGLHDPVRVDLFGPGTRVTLRVGTYNVDRSLVYAQVGDEPSVLLVPTAIRRYAMAEVEDFRSARVVDFDLGVVTGYSVLNRPDGGPDVRWDRRDGAWFAVSGGDTIKGEASDVEAPLRRLRGLRVRRFAPDSLRGLFDDRAPRILIDKQSPHPSQTVSIAVDADGAVLATVGTGQRVVEVDSSIVVAMSRSVSDARNRRLMAFDPARLGRVALTTPDTLATIVRAGTGWSYPNPALGQMNPEQVNVVLRALQNIRFARVVSEDIPAEFADGATFTLVAESADGTIMDEVWCRPGPDAATLLVAGRRSGVVAEMSATDMQRLVALFHRIRER